MQHHLISSYNDDGKPSQQQPSHHTGVLILLLLLIIIIVYYMSIVSLSKKAGNVFVVGKARVKYVKLKEKKNEMNVLKVVIRSKEEPKLLRYSNSLK